MRDTIPLPPRSTASFRPGPSPTRMVVMSRRSALAGGLFVAATLVWGGATTYYIAFRDEVAQRFFAHETEMRFRYEDRIGDLSGRLAREVTQGMVERTGFEARAEVLASRQAAIEAHQARLMGLAERLAGSPAASSPAAAGLAAGDKAVPVGAKPLPLFDPGSMRMRDAGERDAGPGSPDRLSSLETRAEAAQAGEIAVAKTLARGARLRVSRLRAVLGATGLDLDRRTAAGDGGTGGPLVPWTEGRPADAFGFVAADLDGDIAEAARLHAIARRLPLGQPISGELEETSPFGYRLDPFTRSQALHTGTDFRIEYGGAVRATGGGRVSIAEYTGGYGNLVEIDHGGGVVTRYGHLSAFLVAPGDRVEAGQAIGRAGSTGRSTGAHVHYETRINGEPVNPTRFLQAGQMLGDGRG